MILRETPTGKMIVRKNVRKVGANPDKASRNREERWGKARWGKKTTNKINHLAKVGAKPVCVGASAYVYTYALLQTLPQVENSSRRKEAGK